MCVHLERLMSFCMKAIVFCDWLADNNNNNRNCYCLQLPSLVVILQRRERQLLLCHVRSDVGKRCFSVIERTRRCDDWSIQHTALFNGEIDVEETDDERKLFSVIDDWSTSHSYATVQYVIVATVRGQYRLGLLCLSVRFSASLFVGAQATTTVDPHTLITAFFVLRTRGPARLVVHNMKTDRWTCRWSVGTAARECQHRYSLNCESASLPVNDYVTSQSRW